MNRSGVAFQGYNSFKEQFRSVDVWMIDDVQFISGKESTRKNHTFNALVEDGRQVIVSADKYQPILRHGRTSALAAWMGYGGYSGTELRLGILQLPSKRR